MRILILREQQAKIPYTRPK